MEKIKMEVMINGKTVLYGYSSDIGSIRLYEKSKRNRTTKPIYSTDKSRKK